MSNESTAAGSEPTNDVPEGTSKRRRVTVWTLAVPVLAAVAGFVFVSSAHTANGTDLRAERRTQLSDLVRANDAKIRAATDRVADLRNSVDELTASTDTSMAEIDPKLTAAAGMEAVTGKAVTVVLDDAPRTNGTPLPAGVTADDLVVHQQDVQAVVNALWKGGATAMQIMDQRVISTSAVRCVGNTLVLQGRVYAPPFRITAVGDPAIMRSALSDSPDVTAYRAWVDAVGLGYKVSEDASVTVPPFDGSVDLLHARSAS